MDDYRCPKCRSFLRVRHMAHEWYCTLCGIEFKPGSPKATSLST